MSNNMPKILLLPFSSRTQSCDICKNTTNLKVWCQLLSDPPIDCEWLCEDCYAAVKDATVQKKYLKLLIL